MDPVVDILNNTRKDKLTTLELHNAVKDYYNNTEIVLRSRSLIYFEAIINKIDVNVLLGLAIKFYKRDLDLALIAFCLNNKAKVNNYIISNSLGKPHILIHTIEMLKGKIEEEDIKLIISLLLMYGSNIEHRAFLKPEEAYETYNTDEKFDTSFIKNYSGKDNIIKKKEHPNCMSVKEWFIKDDSEEFLNYRNFLEKKSDVDKMNISTICDKLILHPKIKTEDDEKEEEKYDEYTFNYWKVPKNLIPRFDFCILSRSKNILELYDPDKDDNNFFINGEYQNIKKCIDSGYLDGFIHLINKGTIVTYYSITRILVQLRLYINNKNITMIDIYQDMIKFVINNGQPLDGEQLIIISTTSPDIANNIVKDYNKPQWLKMCNNPTVGNMTEGLKIIGYNLNLSSLNNKNNVCGKLNEFYRADQEALKNAAILRQQSRVTSDVSNISDFINGKVTPVTCSNKTLRQTNPFEYGDAALSYYRDDNNEVWCFLSNMYESLIENPINPYTNKELPEKFQAQLQTHLDILKKLGISPSNPVPIHQAIDNLKINDEITNKESEKIVETILQLVEISGISPRKIKNMTPEELNKVLAVMDMYQDLITIQIGGKYILSREHQIITFCRAIYEIIKKNPHKSKDFIREVGLV